MIGRAGTPDPRRAPRPRSLRRSRRGASAVSALLLVVVVTMTGAVPAPSVGARPGPSTQQPSASRPLTVTSVSPWVPSDGEFQIRFDPSTVPPDSLLTTTIHQSLDPDDGSTLRDEVLEILEGASPGRILQAPVTVPLSELGDPAAGLAMTIPIRSRRGDSDRVLLPNPGIHPVELVLTSPGGPELWRQVVFLNRLPVESTLDESDDENDTGRASAHVAVTLLVPIDSGPALRLDGTSAFTPEDRARLAATAALLADAPDAPLTVAPRPNTLDGLVASDDAWASSLLDGLADRGSAHALLALPYAPVSAGGLVAANAEVDLVHHIELGRDTIEGLTGRSPVADTWAFDDTVTPESLGVLARTGVRSVLLPAEAVDPPDDVDAEELAHTPFAIDRGQGLRAITYDTTVSEMLVRAEGGPGTRAHEVVTMLMATWFTHDSGIGDTRPTSVALVPPGADPRVLELLRSPLTGDGPLRADPGAEMIPPVDDGSDGSSGRSGGARTIALADRSIPDMAIPVRATSDTRRVTEAYRSMTGTGDPALRTWERLNDQSLSPTLDNGRRTDLHLGVRQAIHDQVDRIEPPPARRITLARRDTTIPLRFRNGLPFEVTLTLRARSPRLDIVGGDVRRITLQPGENLVDLPVSIQAPGESLLRVELASPIEGITLDGPDVPVRSTAISGVGTALSVVSAAFLVGWWVHTTRRKRRASARHETRSHPSTKPGADNVAPGG